MPALHVNVLAVIVAALSAFLVGGLWYSPALFAGSWQRVNGFSAADLAGRKKARIFTLAFILTLVMALNLAMFLDQPTTTWAWGATAGFLAGFGWVALGLGVISLFESRPFVYVAINGGYMVVAFVIMGAIIGAWR
jgi:membrane-associated HD superfamily phosphohydrolase